MRESISSFRGKKGNHMRKTMLAALGAATMLFAYPAAAQEFPVTGGDYWTVSEITIDDGHFGDYADHLAGLYRKQGKTTEAEREMQEFQKLQNPAASPESVQK